VKRFIEDAIPSLDQSRETNMFRFVLASAAIDGILAAQPAIARTSATMTSDQTQSTTAERGKAIAYDFDEDDAVSEGTKAGWNRAGNDG
jgi:hypothetical protein